MTDAFSLNGKTILITGASSGIGKQIACSCAEAGASVIVSGRDSERLHAVLTSLPGSGHSSLILDLTNDVALKCAAEMVEKIDGVVHCAGISMLSPLRLVTRSHIEIQLSSNLIGPMLLTKQLLLRNSINQGGSIVFISSISAHIGVHGVSSYSASKGALEAMARSLAMEVAKKRMRVNCLAPGLVQTPMYEAAVSTTGGLEETIKNYPLGIGKPEDVAYSAIFLLSNASRWITGTTLVIDGGHTVG
ncbi:NAD(P)-dependent dehydrogenase (short-subunit alcohol dehydrogenase family) [Delftia sp. 60]|uniref:SDR family NAD(P)-dependent oxidoreductase n=1 Tax=Delftia sp. 60 TaxID=2035216 RepID=UPI000C19A3C0|nr:SDR family oxidoreductase [Delftia sp. 60]PIF34903.1 NAD(P)-dependent dehydrogenase (short-subunit alcohol dehydrogenase family) [Burkholderiales bacterium 23]PIF64313.1 NAD(P)-dependent dehydrogenase (short-subunit alcohol dehydrogenase family) [Delftia sp. 60]